MADGGGGQVEFVGRAVHALCSGNAFEGDDGLQRWNTHSEFFSVAVEQNCIAAMSASLPF